MAPGPSRILSVTEVIFERIAPVLNVQDVEAALARYRRLGFATELDEPAGYGFVERGAVQLHLQPDDPDDPGGTGGLVYLRVSDAEALHAEWTSEVSEAGFMGPHNTPYGLRELCIPTPTGLSIKSARRSDQGARPRSPALKVVVPGDLGVPLHREGDSFHAGDGSIPFFKTSDIGSPGRGRHHRSDLCLDCFLCERINTAPRCR